MNIRKLRSLKIIRAKTNEDGFTLLELMITVIVIGILAGIMIPVFATQQKSGIEATLKADLRQAALVMHTESIRNAGRYGSYVPSYQTQSASNSVSLDRTRSSSAAFCLSGTNPNIPTVTLYYSSTSGKINSTPCAVIGSSTGGTAFSVSQASALTTKKAVIVASTNISASDLGVSKIELQNLGFGTVDILSESSFLAASPSTYQFVYLKYSVWAPPANVHAAAYTAYSSGAKVFVDGNDASAGSIPEFVKTATYASSGSMLIPTYKQGLNPSFPYTFSGVAFGSDGWSCVTSLQQGVALAIMPGGSSNGSDCITMFGANNSNDGRYIYMTTSTNTEVRDAGYTWLTS